jgi:hypothetical protein
MAHLPFGKAKTHLSISTKGKAHARSADRVLLLKFGHFLNRLAWESLVETEHCACDCANQRAGLALSTGSQ